MTSIQQQAAELAEEWKIAADFNDKSGVVNVGNLMAALLRQIASMGGDVEPVARAEAIQDGPFRYLRFVDMGCPPVNADLYTDDQLETARLAGFEAGRRKGLEDAARVCDKSSSFAVSTPYRNGASDCAALIRFLIKKEA